MGTVRLAALISLLICFATFARGATSIETIRKVGFVRCGIDRSESEFSPADEHGARIAFDQAFCEAVAVAVLGQTAKVVMKTYPDDQTSIAALKAGAVDLIASASRDLSHSKDLDITFTRPTLYDGQELMVPLKLHLTRAVDLAGKTVCFLDETEGADSIRSWFRELSLTITAFPFQEQGEMEAAFVTDNCAALAGDATRLANTRASFGSNADAYAILPDILSEDPLAAAYLSGDGEWGRVIEWTFNVLLQAEESGITSANVDAQRTSNDPTVRRMMGITHDVGEALRLDPAWAANVIHAVGNYGQIYDRTLGTRSNLKLPRGRNALWKNGGLMEALPLK